jgi:hypothetical protein
MKGWLGFAHAVDWLNGRVAKVAVWAMFISCMVSAVNATLRYLISESSNAWLELQWYLFAATVMLGAPFVLKVNEHVRVDIVYSRLEPRRQAMVDLMGLLIFVMPAAVLLSWMAMPYVIDSYVGREMSSNAGGLLRWPFKVLVPIGFALLALQGISEIIKRIAFIRGLYTMDTHYERPLQ